ncbi:hypothetical protein JCM19238_3519 [Vibrio ponticus]|nr:hypothetical protein JCM19238_3519 [Vibrio ponticus]
MLLEMQWWNWGDDALQGAMPLLSSQDIAALYRYWRENVQK